MIRYAAPVLFLLLTASGPVRKQPPLPPDEWKGTNFRLAAGVSLDPEAPFGLTVHEKLTPSGEICSDQLNAAIYRQDILHAFESAAHFDNCAFESSTAYIDSRLEEASKKFAAAGKIAPEKGVPSEIQDGMLALGQALHAIQDFYAHTDYVERIQKQKPDMTSESQIPVVNLWNPEKRAQARAAMNGLVSGKVWWSFPQRCASKVPAHHALAKDSATMPAGKKASLWSSVSGGQISNHQVAFNLAGRATREYLSWSAQRWPQIRQHCGQALKYIVQADRRNDPTEEQ